MQSSLRGAARSFSRHTFVASRVPPALPRRLSVMASATAKHGDYVAVHYKGTLDNGEVFDESKGKGRGPLEFQVGGGQMIKGFDRAVTGMAVGETRKVRLEPEEAYGEYNDEMKMDVPAGSAPKGLSEGVQVMLSNGMRATVVKVTDENVTIDLNHELAGKHLNFEVTLESLTPADRLQRVVFGAGCFWGPELAFQRVPGVIATEVGYSQGSKANPSYEDVCTGKTGHTEVVRVTFDPEVVSFLQLLDKHWELHDPHSKDRQGNDSGTQYRAGIYTTTPEQLEEATRFLETKKAANKGPAIHTELEPCREYYRAEDYHQQYLSKGGRFGRPQDPSKGCNDPIRCYG